MQLVFFFKCDDQECVNTYSQESVWFLQRKSRRKTRTKLCASNSHIESVVPENIDDGRVRLIHCLPKDAGLLVKLKEFCQDFTKERQ